MSSAAPTPSPDPLVVIASRGGHVETRHAVSYVIVDETGIRASAGDTNAPVFGRSSTKPFQTVPLVTSGAAEAFDLDDRHLALACASHNGEDTHVELVTEWLERIGCSEQDLECGVMRPFQPERDRELVALGVNPDQRHHMCSGKHAGYLTLAKHLGAPTAGYVRAHHPAQQMVTTALQDLTGSDLSLMPSGTDGCGVPTHATSLVEFARGAWWFVPDLEPAAPPDAASPDAARVTAPSALQRAACQRISAAMRNHPDLVAGTNRLCTEAMVAASDQLALKTGAAGFFFAAARPVGGGPHSPFSLALKAHDGSTEAAEIALLHLLKSHGIDLVDHDRMIDRRHSITTVTGDVVGSRSVAP